MLRLCSNPLLTCSPDVAGRWATVIWAGVQGPYKPFGIIPAPSLGTHDSDWEHVTVRLTVTTTPLSPPCHFTPQGCHSHAPGLL